MSAWGDSWLTAWGTSWDQLTSSGDLVTPPTALELNSGRTRLNLSSDGVTMLAVNTGRTFLALNIGDPPGDDELFDVLFDGESVTFLGEALTFTP